MSKYYLLCIALFVCLSCDKEKLFDGPDYFTEDFENYDAFEELFADDDQFWSFSQLTRSGNQITVDTTHTFSGQRALKFIADPTGDQGASKASIVKQKMAFWEGETVRLTAHYFIAGNESLEWLFLMDLEEQTAIGAGPGMRLALVDDALRVEYKFNERDILQTIDPAVPFPRNEWVAIVWEVELSTNDDASVRIWQNSELILESYDHKTLPTDILYFQQGTKGMYSSCEIGITANSHDNALTIWVDDVTFERSK
ncbi:MAG: heparin lyase I family protein [Cyclobacteriaceae bacterium]